MSANLKTRKCRVCGCTDAKACPGGCSWVAEDLCSSCVPATYTPEELAAGLSLLLKGDFVLKLTGTQAFQLVAGLQLLLRRPDIGEGIRKELGMIARSIQKAISVTPAIAQFVEAGWNPTFDIPSQVEPQEERRIIIP